MRIGIISGEYPPLQGGVGAYTDLLSRIFSERGHQVFVFSEPRAEQQLDTIPLTKHAGWGFGAVRAIQKWIAQNQIEIVNLQFQTAAYKMSPVIHFLPHFIDKPFITTFHDLRFPYLFPKAGELRDWIVLHLASVSDRIIVTDYEDYQRVAHLPCVEVIPIGSNILGDVPPDFDAAVWRKKAGASDGDFLLAYFGFINHSKGVDVLLQAMAQLNQPNIKLVMIGGRTGTADPTNAAYADSIDKLIVDLNLSDKIIWTGFIEDAEVSAYLRAADVVVLPFRDGASFRRGSLMAAIQHECAIITTYPTHTAIPFTPDNMILVRPNDATVIANAIVTLSATPQLCYQLQIGVAHLKRLFDWQIIASSYEQLFKRVMGAKSA